MTDQVHTITEDQLHAYVDGQLDDTTRRVVERHLAQNADAAARVKSWQTLNQGLQQLASGLNAAPGRVLDWKHGASDELGARRMRRGLTSRFAQITTVAASLAIGVLGGWMAHDSQHEREEYAQFVKQAAVAYKVFASPVQARPVEITADERDRLQRWLSGKMGLNFAMSVPKLEMQGWSLVGGRMLSDAAGPAALYVYENGEKTRIALYVVTKPEASKMGLTWTPESSALVADWGYNQLHMAVAGPIAQDKIKELLGPINQQIVAGGNAASETASVPGLPVPQITVSLNTHR